MKAMLEGADKDSNADLVAAVQKAQRWLTGS